MAYNNLPVVNIKEFKEIVKAQMIEGNKRPIFGLGKGGIGKTEAIKEMAINELKIGYIDIRLLMYNEVDLKGIPYPNNEHTATVWLQNNILPIVERDGEQGILVLDEITSVARSVRTAAYQLLNERQLGEYRLPDGWMVVCLGNGEEDGGDFQGTEGNFANRCSVYNVVPDLEIWKEWAYSNSINPLVIAFVSWMPSSIHTYNDEEATTNLLFASPRSWKAVSDVLNSNPNVDFNNDKSSKITRLRILGNLGTTVGTQFITFIKLRSEEVDYNSILKTGDGPNLNNKAEQLFIAMQGLINIVGAKIESEFKSGQNISNESLMMCANCLKYILKSDKLEHRTLGVVDLIRRLNLIKEGSAAKILLNPGFASICPEIIKFAEENDKIFSVV